MKKSDMAFVVLIDIVSSIAGGIYADSFSFGVMVCFALLAIVMTIDVCMGNIRVSIIYPQLPPPPEPSVDHKLHSSRSPFAPPIRK